MAIVKGTDSLTANVTGNDSGGSNEDRILRYIKADETIKVRLLGSQEFARVPVYDIYPLTGTVGIPTEVNHFEAGLKLLFANSDKVSKELGVEEKRKDMTATQFSDWKKTPEAKPYIDAIQEAYRLSKESRFLFAFIDAETGKPFVMQASENAGAAINKLIEGYQEQKDLMLFNITKAKGGFTVLPDMSSFGKLTPEQQTIFNDTASYEAPIELFADAHFKPDAKFQLEVLEKMNASGIAEGVFTEYLAEHKTASTEEKAPEGTNVGEPLGDIKDEDLPF